MFDILKISLAPAAVLVHESSSGSSAARNDDAAGGDGWEGVKFAHHKMRQSHCCWRGEGVGVGVVRYLMLLMPQHHNRHSDAMQHK